MPKKQKTTGRRNRTTTRKVQATENRPFVAPSVNADPEIDTDAWGPDGLTLKQRLFVQFYVGEAGGNATRAAQLAGYRDDNNLSLRATASENLTKPNIQRALEREIGKKFGTPEDIRNSVSAIARGSGADILERDSKTGKLETSLDKLAEAGALGSLQQIQEEVIEVDGVRISTTKRKIKLYDRLRALELLAKIQGMLSNERPEPDEPRVIRMRPVSRTMSDECAGTN